MENFADNFMYPTYETTLFDFFYPSVFIQRPVQYTNPDPLSRSKLLTFFVDVIVFEELHR